MTLADLSPRTQNRPQAYDTRSLAASPDPGVNWDRVMAETGTILTQQLWRCADGSEVPLLLTAGRWNLYQCLCSVLDVPGKAARSARAVHDAGVLIYLMAHPEEVWELTREIAIEGQVRPYMDPPFQSNLAELFLPAVREWCDVHIPLWRGSEACEVALRAVSAWQVQPVHVPEVGDVEEDDQKKTPSPTGSTDTSPSSPELLVATGETLSGESPSTKA